MSMINYAKKEISFKIVYYGAGVVGKTVNLQYIHRSLPDDNRGNLISLATGDERTLFFDFLPVSALSPCATSWRSSSSTRCPGRMYYNMTRKLVLRGVDGIVFVADSQWDRLQENVESFKNLEENLREYDYDLDELPYVIQYNKRDLPERRPVEYLEFAPQPALAARAVLRGRRGRRHGGVRHAQYRVADGPRERVRARGDAPMSTPDVGIHERGRRGASTRSWRASSRSRARSTRS